MRLTKEQYAGLETPCLVVDMAQVCRNIEAMQRMVHQTGCQLRPHIKTHKIGRLANLQVAAGADGITCAKVSEAEVMADHGIQDIFIAYPLVGMPRITRALCLHRRVRRLILAVDSLEGARLLSSAAVAANTEVELRLELDTGAGRTGVPLHKAVALAKQITGLPGLRLTGIFTFKGLVYRGAVTADASLAAQEEGQMLAQTAVALRAEGIPIQDISGGSTPTGIPLAKTGLVTEVRPGTYIFNDALLCSEGAACPEQVAVRYVATVVSAHYPEYAVIDGGSKTFSADIPLHQPPLNAAGYALVEGSDDVYLTRMNEEHGILTARSGHTGLRVGDQVTLIPLHVCTAVNLQNQVYLLEEDGRLVCQKVDARGMLL